METQGLRKWIASHAACRMGKWGRRELYIEAASRDWIGAVVYPKVEVNGSVTEVRIPTPQKPDLPIRPVADGLLKAMVAAERKERSRVEIERQYKQLVEALASPIEPTWANRIRSRRR